MLPIQTHDKNFHDGDGQSVLGTILPAKWLNDVQWELLNILHAANIEPDGAKQDQISSAIKKIFANEQSLIVSQSLTGTSKEKVASEDALRQVNNAAKLAKEKADQVGIQANNIVKRLDNAGIASSYGGHISPDGISIFNSIGDIDINGFYRIGGSVTDAYPGHLSGDALIHAQWTKTHGFNLAVQNKKNELWYQGIFAEKRGDWLRALTNNDISNSITGVSKDKISSEFAVGEVNKLASTANINAINAQTSASSAQTSANSAWTLANSKVTRNGLLWSNWFMEAGSAKPEHINGGHVVWLVNKRMPAGGVFTGKYEVRGPQNSVEVRFQYFIY